MKLTNSKVSIGTTLVVSGLILNKWTLSQVLPGELAVQISSSSFALQAFQFAAICAGGTLLLQASQIKLKDIALVAGSILFCLLALEAGVRVWISYIATDLQTTRYKLSSDVGPERLRWSPHHYLNYFPTPNYRRGKTSHNALGYRNREIELPKPKDVFRIAILGGSTTYTIKVEDNELTFPRQLEKIIRERSGNRRIDVINAGVGGYNSWETLVNLQFRVLDLHPDLVIIHHGTNDVHTRLVPPAAFRGDNSGRRRQWTVPTTSLLLRYSILARIVGSSLDINFFRTAGLGSFVNAETYMGAGSGNPASNPMSLLDQNSTAYFERNLRSMIAVSKIHKVDIVLTSWAHSSTFDDYASSIPYQRGFRETNEAVRRIASEQRVPFFDFAKKMPAKKKFWADGRHVNEEGAQVKAQLFADFLIAAQLLPPIANARQ